METESDRTSFLSPALQGIIIPNVLAAIVLAIIYIVGKNDSEADAAGKIGTTAFFVVPILMGLMSAYFWRDLDWSAWLYAGYSAITFGISLLLAAIVAQEGIFCLLIVSPLVYLELLIGAVIGKLVFRRKNTMLSSSVLGILALFVLFDLMSEHNYCNEVVDTIVIHASPEQVWKYVAATPRNDAPSEWWFFGIGLPRPIETTVSDYRQGAKRACVFSNGVVFDEVMSVYEPNRELTFDIVKQPADPEIIGHITMDKGQFLLHDNGDGTTTLTGTSWYRLHVYPAWYFDLWAEAITRNVHLHAMKHIKLLAERGE
jgi:hypothetical protein